MLFVLNIDELIIIYINLNDKINKRIICIVSFYPIKKDDKELPKMSTKYFSKISPQNHWYGHRNHNI